jgi:hypothetical protein
MTYTFWHSGVLIGESDLDYPSGKPRQIGGMFRPTAYGLEIFPRLTGILSAGHALKSYVDANGLSPDTMSADEVEELLKTTEAGQKVIDIGRTLCDVELRGPDGGRLEFASIAFSDLLEVQRLARELDVAGEVLDLPELPPDMPRYIVSATLSANTPPPARPGKARRYRRGN